MRFSKVFLLKICYILFMFAMHSTVVLAKARNKRGVVDNVNDGLKYAAQMFGINTAADVANLVAKAFSSTTTRRKPDIMSIFQQQQNPDRTEDRQQQQHQHQTYEQQQHYEASREQQHYNEPNAEQSVRNGEAAADESQELNSGTARLITNVLKMIGFDAGKLGALAINALIMIAQAIGSTLMPSITRKRVVSATEGGRLYGDGSDDSTNYESSADAKQDKAQERMMRGGSPIDWFLENPNKQMRSIIGDITDAKLSDRITNMIEQLESKQSAGEQGACIKMLMCKSSPFIWGMQKSLAKRFDKSNLNDQQTAEAKEQEEEQQRKNFMSTSGFFTHLPSIAEYREHGEQCEQRYANHCNTTDLYKH